MIDFLMEIIWELQDIPGLGFLRNFREAVMHKKSQLMRKKNELEVRRQNIVGAKSRLQSVGKGSKRRVE